MLELTTGQRQIIKAPLNTRLFLSGPAGTGKSTVGVERLNYLLANGVPGKSVLVLTPQRTLQEPYLEVIRSPATLAGGEVDSGYTWWLGASYVRSVLALASVLAGFAYPGRPRCS